MNTACGAVRQAAEFAESTARDQAVEPSRSRVAAEFLERTLDLVGDVAVEFIHDADARRHVGAAGIMNVNAERVCIPFGIAQ